ncbi:electron transport protein SCO1/SenC [Deinococcus aerius]|uniref:Electron transport protein SCO1/SenC n=2 Tax=Deinococcus TaxID=1298 RepID=A0A2I9D361_9DEIO|nr:MULTISPECIES: SCO family protein [Deinococcus]MBB5293942.1 protein SCO1/2 [Deinococcus metallilatus]QBY07484.1 SCO family protein [Deinococcus metallilatus]RXJ14597.1 SCO family protein [Deinococcus metallilatus]TLK30717.1 SCO family protein [Deinococcus metallilatus]GBF04600.1 electron transport protein SCO1/SenC [Deinococcus aerius]
MTAPPTRPVWQSLLWALLAVTLLLGGAWAYARLKNPFPFYGTVYDAETTAPALTGTGEDGRPFALSGLKGQTVAVFFGFLHCPNICPTTLAALERVRQALPEADRANFRSVLVTLDPARDDVGKLREYVRFFSPSAKGVFIPEPQLADTAADWGVGYQKADVKGLSYQINHTTGVYLIDREGRRRVVWDYTQLTKVDRVAADVREVMR